MKWHRRARHALAHSLRVRLVALFLLLALAMSGVFLLGMQTAISIGWREAARPFVADYVDKLAAEVGSPPSVERAQALVQRLPLRIHIDGPQVNWASHPKSPDYQRHWRRDEPRLLERSTPDGHRIAFGLQLPPWSDAPHDVGLMTLAGLLLLTALAYWRIQRMLRPLGDMRAAALRFGAGNFEQAIVVRHPGHPDELGELAITINTMAQDLRQMLDAKRTLLLAISHELRSPLTRARLHTELLPETPELQPQRQALLTDLALMRDLVADLLESERLSERHAALQRETTDIAALVRDVVAQLQDPWRESGFEPPGAGGSPAVDWQVQLAIAPGLPLLSIDPSRVRLLVRNLLDNALRHSADASSPPQIHLSPAAGKGVALVVRDFGPGVADDQLGKLAQAFYRPDSARERATGGVGLGLHLCKLVAEAHGGTMRIANGHPGLEITVTFP